MEFGAEPSESSPIGALGNCLEELAQDFLPTMSPTELGKRCLDLQAARNRINALLTVAVNEAEVAGTPLETRQRTMAQFMASEQHLDPAVTRADRLLGSWISSFPLLEQALVDGLITIDHANHVRKMDNIRVHEALKRDQHLVIQWVSWFEWPDFKQMALEWLLVNDQDGPEPEDHDVKNTLSLSVGADGRMKFVANLDPVSGEILRQQLGDESNALLNEDNECGHLRSVGQRRAQAFVNIIKRGAGRTESSAKPLIHIVMSLQVLQNAIDQLAKDPSEQDFTSMLDRRDPDARCELIDGTPIHPKYALIMMMNARIRRQVLTAKNVTLSASHPTDAFPEWMRHIRLVETRGKCGVAGCDAPHNWLQADHRVPRAKQGPTELANLDMLCQPDNGHKGTGGPMKKRDED